MTPQTGTIEQETPKQTRTEEQFVRQVEDHSLPAQQVLTDQQQGCRADEAPVLFVP